MSVHRRAQRTSRVLAAGLAITALTAPAAGARPLLEPVGARSTPRATAVTTAPRRPAPTVVRDVDAGFDWSSAAIGAGSGAGIVLLTVAGASAAISRRNSHGLHPTTHHS